MNSEIFAEVDCYIANLLAPQDEALLATIESLDKAGMPQHSVSSNKSALCIVKTELFCSIDDVLIQSLQVGEPAQRAESLFALYLNLLGADNYLKTENAVAIALRAPAKLIAEKKLGLSEIMTILISFHTSGCRNFKAFYLNIVSQRLSRLAKPSRRHPA